jgi:NAD(P)-dependent dehydrogenase (short-subunit alcohol dehydrogenase family)
MSHGRFDNPVVAALAGVKDFFRKQKLTDRLKDTDRADGKTILITGANSGLGFGLAVDFAKRGGRVIMACRRQIPEAGEKVEKLSGSKLVEMRHLDLSKLDSIHAFCDGLVQDNVKPDVTILNAGVALAKARKTDSGQEEMFFVNYLSNVILTHLMLDKEIISLKRTTNLPRIIFISSDSHQGSSFIDYDEFGKYIDYGTSKGIANYSYFKLVLNTYAVELSRRLNKNGQLKAGINIICPGPVSSNIIKEAPLPLRMVLKGIFSIIFKSPAEAAKAVVYMSLSDDYDGKTEEYLHMFNPKKMDEKVYLPDEGKKLWDASMALWGSFDTKAVQGI